MRYFRRLSFVVLMFLAVSPASAEASAKDNGFDWSPVMDAIMMVESKGNARAVNGQYAGILQISPILVRECNNILKVRGSGKRYSLSDRFSASKSREMFVLIQSFHNPLNSVEKAIRIWNGGLRYNIRRTQKYFNRVMGFLR
ncbi:hypothetical protein [Prevotella dentasini]